MRNPGSHAPFGTLRDIQGGAAKSTKGRCACGARLRNARARFCGPFYATRLDETIARNRAKYAAAKKASRLLSPPCPPQ